MDEGPIQASAIDLPFIGGKQFGALSWRAICMNRKELKLKKLIDDLKNILDQSASPVLCWSGGKDSTLLLHLLVEINPGMHVLSFPHFWDDYQKEFLVEAFDKYRPSLFFYRPNGLNYYPGYLIAYYNIGGVEMPVIFDHIKDTNLGQDVRCGLNIGKSVLSDSPVPSYIWDVTIVGTKSSDHHVLTGNLDFSKFAANTEIKTPLWDWTDADVIDVAKNIGVKLDSRVYTDGDDRADTGAFYACMRCVNKQEEVLCPKTGNMVLGVS